MTSGRAPMAPVANLAWSDVLLSLAPDVAACDNTCLAVGEAQFAAPVRVPCLASAHSVGGVGDVRTTIGRSAIGPCADR
jgi:hypothetical protein